ncbi:MAG: MarR family winged helix-turn-helix transcriptional regulator [Candidatus Binatia bacterium]
MERSPKAPPYSSAADAPGSEADVELDIVYELGSLLASSFRVFVSDPAGQTRHGATPAQLRILQLLSIRPGISVTEVARSLAITNASASVAIGRLADSRWIERYPDPADARRCHVKLSDEGRGVLAEFETLQLERVKTLLDEFGEEEIGTFRSLVGRAARRIVDIYGEEIP